MKKIILLSALLICAYSAAAGVSIDSLQVQLTTAQGKERLRVLAEMTEYYRNSDPEKTLFYAGLTDSLLVLYPDTLLQIRLYRYKCTAYRMLSRYVEAMDYATKSLNLAQAAKDSVGVMRSYNSLGLVYWNIGRLDLAQQYFMDALKTADKLGLKADQASAYNNLALIYADMRDYEKSKKYFLEAVKNTENVDNPGFFSVLCLNLGNVYNDTHDYDKALEYYNRALEIAQTVGDKSTAADVYSGIGVIKIRQKDYAASAQYAVKALAIYEDLDMKSEISRQLCNLAEIRMEESKFAEAVELGELSLQTAKEINSLVRIKEAYGTCAKVYEQAGQLGKALENFRQYQIYADSLFDAEKAAKAAEFEIIYEVSLKEREIGQLKLDGMMQESELKRQRTLNYATTACAVIFLVLSASTLYFYRQKDKINRQLEKSLRELREAMDEIKTLKGLIPICANCKKIRTDEGIWEQIEQYISEHSEAEFSHGICPDCVKELYPEYYDRVKGKKTS